MVADRRVMTNMISTPERHVVSDPDKRLQGIIFENKAVFPYLDPLKNGGARTYVTYELIAHRFTCQVLFLANLFNCE